MLDSEFILQNFVHVGSSDRIFHTTNAFLTDPDRPNRIIGLNICRRGIGSVDELLDFEHLQYLDASENDIVDISALAYLRELRVADLSFNKISNAYPLVGLQHLEKVNLCSNKIQRVPTSFSALDLPLLWRDDKKGRGVVLSGNPLSGEFISLLTDPSPRQAEIKEFLAKSSEDYEEPISSTVEARILIVGPGNVGKTTFFRGLQREATRRSQRPTEGIDIGEHATLSRGKRFIYKIWDFGGQKVQYSFHRLFFANHCLFFLVLDSRKEESPDKWLDYIRSFAPKARIVVVLNKIDEHPMFDIDRASLRNAFPNVIGVFQVCSLTESGFSDIVRLLREYSESVDCHKVVVDEKTALARMQLASLRDETPFIGRAQFDEICDRNGIARDAQWDFIVSMEILGEILTVDTVDDIVIYPKWLLQAVAGTLLSNRLSDHKGIVSEGDLRKTLEPYTQRYTNYGRAHQQSIISLMAKFDLLYVYAPIGHSDRTTVVIPSALSRQSIEWNSGEKSVRIAIDLLFNSVPLMHKLIVRLLALGITQKENVWYSGALLSAPGASSSVGVVIADEARNSIRVQIEIPHAIGLLPQLIVIIRELASTENTSFISRESISLGHIHGFEDLTEEYVDFLDISAHVDLNMTEMVHSRTRRLVPISQLQVFPNLIRGQAAESDGIPSSGFGWYRQL
ncbi:Miro-like protein [Stieleria neptunia]|uniref:Miro-like protein n=1 Tax=Stieleria neptunia TaxID=2527979 RepID=A0A518HII8_9BACT|nr:COR domain-containing protein [Stieleria neptunia]QDV40674.1 Miro-like protein [Stieleria neptunia]